MLDIFDITKSYSGTLLCANRKYACGTYMEGLILNVWIHIPQTVNLPSRGYKTKLMAKCGSARLSNPSTWEPEATGSLWFWGQFVQHSEFNVNLDNTVRPCLKKIN